jgi:peptidyl-prolyl cis-trans isomerase C
MARLHSQCPSGKGGGGDLGEFSPGQMVAEFDSVVFSGELGKIHGPVQTQFGYHLIEITNRTD